MSYKIDKYETRAIFKARAAVVIRTYDDLVQIWSVVAATAIDFNGKVLNRRFTTAVNKQITEIGTVSLDKDNIGQYHLSVHLRNLYDSGYGLDKIICATGMYDFYECVREGAIDAQKIQDKALFRIQHIRDHMVRWTDASERFDEYRDMYNAATKRFAADLEQINPMFVPETIRPYLLKSK